MEFLIADTFTDSLGRLTGEEQKVAKTTAFDLQTNPSVPGLQLHKLDRTRDKNFWSVRVGSDLRIIVHKTESSLLICYVDHHDKAYLWAERRKLETHPTTGAAQLVEIRETVREVPRYVEVERPAPKKPALFGKVPEGELLGYGVPPEWIADVRTADEDSLLELAAHLPAEAEVLAYPPEAAPAYAPWAAALRQYSLSMNVREPFHADAAARLSKRLFECHFATSEPTATPKPVPGRVPNPAGFY